MMSTMVRLNTDIRSDTCHNVLAKKFAGDVAKIDEYRTKIQALEKEVWKGSYEAVYSEKTRKMLADAPDGYFPKVQEVRVRKVDVNDEENYEDIKVHFEAPQRVPFKHAGHYASTFAAVLQSDHPLFEKMNELDELIREFEEFRDNYRDRRRAMETKVMNVLNSVTTVKRIIEVWPQVQEFLPEMVSGPAGGVPAYVIEDLNNEIGL